MLSVKKRKTLYLIPVLLYYKLLKMNQTIFTIITKTLRTMNTIKNISAAETLTAKQQNNIKGGRYVAPKPPTTQKPTTYPWRP